MLLLILAPLIVPGWQESTLKDVCTCIWVVDYCYSVWCFVVVREQSGIKENGLHLNVKPFRDHTCSRIQYLFKQLALKPRYDAFEDCECTKS